MTSAKGIYGLESVNRLTWITQIIWISQPLHLAKLDFTARGLVLVAKLDSTVRLLLISDSTDNLRFHAQIISDSTHRESQISRTFQPGRELAIPMLVTVLTSTYPAILYPGLFGVGADLRVLVFLGLRCAVSNRKRLGSPGTGPCTP